MKAEECSKEELLNELNELRKRNRELELKDTKLLQRISVESLQEDNIQALYERIIETAMHIMHSDYASMQMLFPERGNGGELKLLAFKGFSEESARFWKWVGIDSQGSACGAALRTGNRVIVPDVEKCDFIKGTEDLKYFLQTGIRSCQTTPLFSRGGKLLGMISTHWKKTYQPLEHELNVMDILARQAADLIESKQAEETLRESEERYRTLFENMNEGFFLAEIICDESGKPVDYIHLVVNPALEHVTGLKSEEIIGKTGRESSLPQNQWIEDFGKVALTGQPLIFEGFSAGLNRYFLISAHSPKKGQFACLIQDITERKILAEKLTQHQEKMLRIEKEKNEVLKKAIKTKDEFLTTITHEFKTPITVINAALQTIDKVYGGEISKNLRKHLLRIRTNTFRQLRLVNNLLDITRYNAGHYKFNMDNIDIVFFTGAIVESVDLYAKQKGVGIKYLPETEYLEIAIDEEKYERILLNLLSNAIKFTPKDKLIIVRISCENRKVVISVTDEGMGIPQNKQELIFERFGQVDNSLSRQAEGTGIGLSLVKALVEGMDGTIEVDSEEDKGSTFTVTFPVARARRMNFDHKLTETQNSRILQATAIEFSDIYLEYNINE